MTDQLHGSDDRGSDDVGQRDEHHQGAGTTLSARVDGADPGPVDAPAAPGVPDDDEDGLFPAPVIAAPHTGDALIDSALDNLEDRASSGDLDEQIEAGERVHRTLRDRLADLGGE